MAFQLQEMLGDHLSLMKQFLDSADNTDMEDEDDTDSSVQTSFDPPRDKLSGGLQT